MTKSEFVDQVADRAGLSKKDAADAVDAVLETIEGALRRGSEVVFSGFGKFSVSDRSAREGRNPATGEKIQIAASRVPKFTAGAASRRRSSSTSRAGSGSVRPASTELVPSSRQSGSPAAGAARRRWPRFRRSTRRRVADASLAARSRSRSGSRSPVAAALELAGGAGDPPAPPDARAALAVADPLRAGARGRRPSMRRGQAPGRLLRASGRAGWAALREVAERAREHGAAGDRRRQARRHRRDRGRVRPGVLRRDADAVRPGRRLGADALTVNPLLGADSLAPFVERRARARGRAVRARAHLQPRRRRCPGARRSRAAARSATGWRDGRRARAPPGSATSGLADVGAVVGATAPERLEASASS